MEVDYYFQAKGIQVKMWTFYEPSERVDTRWRKSFQIKYIILPRISMIIRRKPRNVIFIKTRLNFIILRFIIFFLSATRMSQTHIPTRALFISFNLKIFLRLLAILLLHLMQFSVGQNWDSWTSYVHCLRHREPCQNFLIFASNSERTDSIHILSLSISFSFASVLYVIPVSAWFFLRTLSLLFPPPRVRVTIVLEARKLVDTNASVYLTTKVSRTN